MPSKLTRAELIERLEAATGPDREIDGLIFGWLHDTEPCGTFILYFDEEKFQFRDPKEDRKAWYVRGENVPAYTASIDAAVALVERVLPGWRICFDATDGIVNDIYLIGPSYRDDRPDQQSSPPIAGKPVALAICIAALKALEGRDG